MISKFRLLPVLCLAGFLGLSSAQAETNEEILQRLQSLNADATASYQSGDFARAADVGLQAAQLFLTVGPSDHFAYGNILHNLGMSHLALGNYQFAGPLLERALEIAGKAEGPESETAANRLNSLGNFYIDSGQYAKAEQQLQRSLALWQKLKGESSRDTGRVLNNLGALYREMARYEDAVSVLERARDIHSNPASAGDAAGAAGLIGPEGLQLLGAAQNNLALAQEEMGDFGAAEKTYQRAIAQQMLGLGGDSAALAITYSNFSSLLARGGHFENAEAYGKRAVDELTKRRGAAHPDVATAINNLAGIYSSWGKPDLAFPLYRDALAIREKAFGSDHPDVADSLNSLGLLAIVQGQPQEAATLITRALDIRRKLLGENHPSTANAINNLAAALFAANRLPEAEKRFAQSLKLLRTAYGEDHPRIADGEANLGDVRFRQQDWRGAVAHFETAMNILSRRTAAAGGKLGSELDGKAASSVLQASPYAGALKAYDRLPPDERAAAIGKAFAALQAMSNTSAAASLAQMAARQSLGDPALSALVRERQDITAEWRAADDRMLAITSLPMEQRNGEETTSLQDRQSEIARRVTAIDETLIAEFPDYMSLANPRPASIAEIQAALKPSEAALVYADTHEDRASPGETFLFAITRDNAAWMKLAEAPDQIANRVLTLRSLLGVSGPERGATAAEDDSGEAFDLSAAHQLYKILVGPVTAAIAGRELIIVTSPAVSALPFHLLLSAEPQSDEPSQAHWLVIDHAMSYLPSATSLTSLRRDAKPSAAKQPYLGIGNPLLVGSAGTDRRAFDVKGCGTRPANVQTAAATSIPPAGHFFRGKFADVERVARLAPLPETADELCAVAESLRGGENSVLLGPDATEANVKAGSEAGRLAEARILHFATHGLVTGELNGLAEPALVLSPPAEATAGDDGLLTASEVSGLKLDADWVILSACNTAAGEGGNAEALSGLARSFFYAGARALLVSHWPVNSQAAVDLTTAAVRKLEGGGTSRAEALRQAMLDEIAQGGARAEPAYWGPFVVIGAGG